MADGADPSMGRHSYGRPISDWNEEILVLAHAVVFNWHKGIGSHWDDSKM